MNNPEELEALEALGDEIAVLSAHQSVLEYERMAKIAVFDRRGGWQIGGYRNCADWLACRAGLSRGAARERVRVARALVDLPQISRAMAAGALSFSQVRALTRVATPENDGDLVAFAQDTTAAQLEQMVRGWKLLDTKSEEDLERRRHAARSLSVFPDSNGMYRVKGVVTAEVGALLMRGIEAGSDELYAVERREALEEETTPEQRRADAIGLLAERAMAVGFGRPDVSAETPEGTPGLIAEPAGHAGDAGDAGDLGEEGDAGGDGGPDCGCGCEAPISGTRAERYQVMLHVDLDMLRAGADEPDGVGTRSDLPNGAGAPIGNGASGTGAPAAANGASGSDAECIGSPLHNHGIRSNLEDGTRVSAETSRRLSCDASVVPVRWAEEGELLDVGRKRRTIPPAIRRALDVRDGGCRFPGCGLRFCEGHHIRHWVDGGETKLKNLVLLCRHHHRLVHHDGFRIRRLRDGRFKFFSPEGIPLGVPPSRGGLVPGDGAATIILDQRRRGIVPDWSTAGARYERESVIPKAKLLAALEAMD